MVQSSYQTCFLFQKLIAELRSKAVIGHARSIEWGNETIAVTNDRVKNFLQALEFDDQLVHKKTYADKVSTLEMPME